MFKKLTMTLALVAGLAAGAVAEEKPAGTAVDAKVPDFTMKDEQGRSFQLYKSTHTRQEIEASVRATAAKYGASKDCDLKTKVDDLKGVKNEDGAVDETLRKQFACDAGAFYGMTATDESAVEFKTVGDIVGWIETAQKGPIVFICWSPNCPTAKGQNDRIIEFAAKAKVRTYAVACNYRDTEEHFANHRDAFDWNLRVFPDKEQKVTDILGGKRTPHFFLVSTDHVLKYAGALDNDAMGYMDDDERIDYLTEAVEAVRAGKEVRTKESKPAG